MGEDEIKHQVKGTATGVRLVFGYIGIFLMFIGGITVTPLLMLAFFPKEFACWPSFVVPGGASFLVGLLLYLLCLFRMERGRLGKHQDSVILIFLWLFALLVGCFPFFLNHFFVKGATSYSFSEAFFEATSGYTATGLTVYKSFLDSIIKNAATNAEAQKLLALDSPHIFLFYRSVTHFFGGVGLVLIVASAIGKGSGMKLYYAEGHNDKLLPSLARTARFILGIYSIFIVLGTLFLWLFGMDWFDALNHSIACLATGGLSTRTTNFFYWTANAQELTSTFASGCSFSNLNGLNGILPLNTIGTEIVAIILMLIGATSFMLHFFLVTFKWGKFIRDAEIKYFLFAMIIFIPLGMISAYTQYREYLPIAMPGSSGLTAVYRWVEVGERVSILKDGSAVEYTVLRPSLGQSFRYSTFQMVSCMTTSGFSNISNILQLGPAVLLMSVVIMTIGGGMGSTAGGIKQYRFIVCLKQVFWDLKYRLAPSHSMHPRTIYRYGHADQISEKEYKDTSSFLILYVFVLIIGAILITMLPNLGFDEGLYMVASALSGTGNSVIDFAGYAAAASVKAAHYNTLLWGLSFFMYLGRLEIAAVLFAIYRGVNDVFRKGDL